MKEGVWARVAETLKKYRLAAAVVLLGIVLMVLPEGETARESAAEKTEEVFDRLAVQREMEEILCAIDGVGELRLMLTVESGTKRELAQDVSGERSAAAGSVKETRETVIVGAGSGAREVVVTQSVYPRFTGALVVCEGGDSAAVRLAVTEALRALTGLTSDRISVLRGTP